MAKQLNKKTIRDGIADRTAPIVFKTKQASMARLGDGSERAEEIVRVGDIVHFDWGGENWGIIHDIYENRGGEVLYIRNTRGFVGEWLSGKTEFRFPAYQCWMAK